ncbi:MAG: PqiC family protein [Proteobacteria bacterium]|nr:PqiC family protein [Pseudomonadota bacterium]MBU1742431.1 PqiC family protein [Pseudomonadota bacterium]
MRRSLVVFCLALAALAAGCPSEPAVMVTSYLVSYKSPAPGGARLPVVIKVRRFEAAAPVQRQSLLWRPGPYRRVTATYSQWQVSPADMVTDFLTRDFAASGLYRAVLRHETDDPAPFEVGGVLLELYGRPGGVVIKIQISLVRPLVIDVTRRFVLQRTYRQIAPLEGEGPEAMVAAVSRAMRLLSARVQADVYRAIKDNLAKSRQKRRRR